MDDMAQHLLVSRASIGAVAAPVVLAGVVTRLLVGVLTMLTGLQLDGIHIVAAAVSLIPLGLITASAAFLLSVRLRSGVVLGIVGGLLVLSFFIDLLETVLKLPTWTQNLSFFQQFGNPLLDGINWSGFLGMTAIAATLIAAAAVLFERADLTRVG
jgi:ABC-type transport system involved in multi-copper enzyme maturation permease subunit